MGGGEFVLCYSMIFKKKNLEMNGSLLPKGRDTFHKIEFDKVLRVERYDYFVTQPLGTCMNYYSQNERIFKWECEIVEVSSQLMIAVSSFLLIALEKIRTRYSYKYFFPFHYRTLLKNILYNVWKII